MARQFQQQRQQTCQQDQNSGDDKAEGEQIRVAHHADKCRDRAAADQITERNRKADREIARVGRRDHGERGEAGGEKPDGERRLKASPRRSSNDSQPNLTAASIRR